MFANVSFRAYSNVQNNQTCLPFQIIVLFTVTKVFIESHRCLHLSVYILCTKAQNQTVPPTSPTQPPIPRINLQQTLSVTGAPRPSLRNTCCPSSSWVRPPLTTTTLFLSTPPSCQATRSCLRTTGYLVSFVLLDQSVNMWHLSQVRDIGVRWLRPITSSQVFFCNPPHPLVSTASLFFPVFLNFMLVLQWQVITKNLIQVDEIKKSLF